MAISDLRALTGALLLALAPAAASAATGGAWSDDPLTTSTRVKAAHYLELRTAIKNKRAVCGLSVPMWTVPISSGAPIKAAALNEIRAAIARLGADLSAAAPVFTAPDPITPRTPLRAVFISEARAEVERLNGVACPGSCVADSDCRQVGCDCGCATSSRCVSGQCVSTSHCCFSAGTLIETPAGRVPVESLERGSALVAYDASSGSAYVSSVAGVRRRVSGERVRVRLSDGRTLLTTAEHPFYDPSVRDYRPIGRIAPGTALLALRADGGADAGVRVLSVESLAEEGPVYSLSVEGKDHNYFADGVLVHNKCFDPDCGKR